MITVIKKIIKGKEGKKHKLDKFRTWDPYSNFMVLPQGHEGSLT